jgi:hypothetical protein
MGRSRGAVALTTLLGITTIVAILGTAIALITFFQGLGVFTQARSREAYYAAEAGVYDALRRLAWNPTTQGQGVVIGTQYTLAVGTATATVSVSPLASSKTTITSIGESQNRRRKLQVEVFIDSTTGAAQILSWKEVNL